MKRKKLTLLLMCGALFLGACSKNGGYTPQEDPEEKEIFDDLDLGEGEDISLGHCRLLGTVYLPKTITSVGEEAFAYCESPMSIEVEYTSEEMADLDKDDPTYGPQPWFNWSKNCFCSITFGVTH